jgi:hypothetical protein
MLFTTQIYVSAEKEWPLKAHILRLKTHIDFGHWIPISYFLDSTQLASDNMKFRQIFFHYLSIHHQPRKTEVSTLQGKLPQPPSGTEMLGDAIGEYSVSKIYVN